MTDKEKSEALRELENEVGACEGCALCQRRKNTVFGRGSEKAKILFVGEAPGENEDLQGKPFVGAAGQLLDRYLEFIGLEEEDYYIANILKCRPAGNRDPLPEEEEACIGYLRRQVQILQPRILICLGRIAAGRIIAPDFKITRDHGKWYEAGQTKMMATYHPSALLRDPRKKEEALDDFKAIAKEFAILSK